MKLSQLEQELERARKQVHVVDLSGPSNFFLPFMIKPLNPMFQGVFIGGSSRESNLFGSSAAVSSGILQFVAA